MFPLLPLICTGTESPSPTYGDVSYGGFARNTLDFWQAEGEGSRPLLILIHGGGWTTGDKSSYRDDVAAYLAKGISVAAINYRLAPTNPLPAPVHDAARALQFLRFKAEEWNIDKSRVCLMGTSAGACTSMWILCHDDLADPTATDPVMRESTRISGAVAINGQTSIDPEQATPWLGPVLLEHRMIHMAVGEDNIEDALDNYETHRDLYNEFSPVNHVSADDPPLFMKYNRSATLPSTTADQAIHHPYYGVHMKKKADQVGMECHLEARSLSRSDVYEYPGKDAFIDAILLKK